MLMFNEHPEALPDEDLFEDLILPTCAYCGQRGALAQWCLIVCLCPGAERARVEEIERGRALAREHEAKARSAQEDAWAEYKRRRAADAARTIAARAAAAEAA